MNQVADNENISYDFQSFHNIKMIIFLLVSIPTRLLHYKVAHRSILRRFILYNPTRVHPGTVIILNSCTQVHFQTFHTVQVLFVDVSILTPVTLYNVCFETCSTVDHLFLHVPWLECVNIDACGAVEILFSQASRFTRATLFQCFPHVSILAHVLLDEVCFDTKPYSQVSKCTIF